MFQLQLQYNLVPRAFSLRKWEVLKTWEIKKPWERHWLAAMGSTSVVRFLVSLRPVVTVQRQASFLHLSCERK